MGKLRLPRRPVFALLTAVLVVLIAEWGSALLYWAATGRWYSNTRLVRAREALRSHSDTSWQTLMPAPTPAQYPNEVIHPYLGYVQQPLPAPPPGTNAVDQHGFHTPSPVIQPANKDQLRVLVTGGSVAHQLGRFAERELSDEIARAKAAVGRKVVLSTAATGGYKQPQQLMALAYALSLGAHFDVVINLDGFNDLVLPAYECAPNGVALHYPRAWALRTNGLQDTPTLASAGGFFALTEMRRDFAAAIQTSWARHFVTANVIWFLGDRWLAGRAQQSFSAVEQTKKSESAGFLRTGPAEAGLDEPAIFQRSTALWVSASIQMNALARGNGAEYFHFLQPNQYVKDSKPLSDEERRRAYNDREGYGPIAIRGYERLIRAGPELRQAGVDFHDLTRIFAEHRESVYVDPCCHVSTDGYRLMAREIGSVVRARLDARER